MKIKLVFNDWVKNGKSIYDTEEGIDLSTGLFHSGTTFNGEIILGEDLEKELKKAMSKGAFPEFLAIFD